MKKIFETPTQVMFWDYEEEEYRFGIAYEDVIICGCCGGIFDINDLEENTPEGKPAIYPYSYWVDLSSAICGGQYPEEYENDTEGKNR